jgi:cytochrome c-type biogenesis protein
VESLVATFLLGLGSAATPCLLPRYPGFIAYLAGTTSDGRPAGGAGLLGLAVLAGLLTTMVLLGVVLSLLAVPFGDILRWSIPITAIVLVAVGVALLAGRNPFNRVAGVQVPVLRNPLAQAYVYGLLVGPVALPCAGPFLVALLAISIGLADSLTRIGSFVVYWLRVRIAARRTGRDRCDPRPGHRASRRAASRGDLPSGRRAAHRDRGVRAVLEHTVIRS